MDIHPAIGAAVIIMVAFVAAIALVLLTGDAKKSVESDGQEVRRSYESDEWL